MSDKDILNVVLLGILVVLVGITSAIPDTPNIVLPATICDDCNLIRSTIWELFKLSEAQAEFLYKKKRGLALFIIGSNRIFVRFDIFPIEFEYFGKGGGR